MLKNKLSVCLLALNEEKNIGKTLKSVQKIADELIVVVDNKTTDKTAKIANEFTNKVFIKPHFDNFHKNKQVAVEMANNNWILWMDADEEIEPDLSKEIIDVLNKPQCTGYKIPRKNMIWGKWLKHTGWYPDYQLRLFQKNKTHFPCQRIHEDPKIDGQIGFLKNHIIHQNYRDVSDFIYKMNKYTSLDAKHNFRDKKPQIKDLIITPIEEFVKRFFIWKGYLDGIHGFVISLMQSFYEMLVVIKAMENVEFEIENANPDDLNKEIKKQLKQGVKNWKWWKNELKIRTTKNPLKKTVLKVGRKIGV
jgi:glycosyltransferase involved in cell wall biosynthesis